MAKVVNALNIIIIRLNILNFIERTKNRNVLFKRLLHLLQIAAIFICATNDKNISCAHSQVLTDTIGNLKEENASSICFGICNVKLETVLQLSLRHLPEVCRYASELFILTFQKRSKNAAKKTAGFYNLNTLMKSAEELSRKAVEGEYGKERPFVLSPEEMDALLGIMTVLLKFYRFEKETFFTMHWIDTVDYTEKYAALSGKVEAQNLNLPPKMPSKLRQAVDQQNELILYSKGILKQEKHTVERLLKIFPQLTQAILMKREEQIEEYKKKVKQRQLVLTTTTLYGSRRPLADVSKKILNSLWQYFLDISLMRYFYVTSNTLLVELLQNEIKLCRTPFDLLDQRSNTEDALDEQFDKYVDILFEMSNEILKSSADRVKLQYDAEEEGEETKAVQEAAEGGIDSGRNDYEKQEEETTESDKGTEEKYIEFQKKVFKRRLNYLKGYQLHQSPWAETALIKMRDKVIPSRDILLDKLKEKGEIMFDELNTQINKELEMPETTYKGSDFHLGNCLIHRTAECLQYCNKHKQVVKKLLRTPLKNVKFEITSARTDDSFVPNWGVYNKSYGKSAHNTFEKKVLPEDTAQESNWRNQNDSNTSSDGEGEGEWQIFHSKRNKKLKSNRRRIGQQKK